MASSFWMAIAAICVTAILVRGVVSIVAVSKRGGGNFGDRVKDLESQVEDLEVKVEDYKARIEVLEKIVTDGKFNLKQEIDNLAANE